MAMRRRDGNGLVANELKVLRAAIETMWSNQPEFHGFALGRLLADLDDSGKLMDQSTLYRSLRRLEARGALESRWEDPKDAANDGREGRLRRYYRVTPAGVALAKSEIARSPGVPREWWQQWVPADA